MKIKKINIVFHVLLNSVMDSLKKASNMKKLSLLIFVMINIFLLNIGIAVASRSTCEAGGNGTWTPSGMVLPDNNGTCTCKSGTPNNDGFCGGATMTNAEKVCRDSGGTGLTGGRCTGCPTGKRSDCGGQEICRTEEEHVICLNNATPTFDGSQPTTEPVTVTEKPRQFNYSLLESFPGFFSAGQTLTDFPRLILSIYKFGIWVVGIAGLFMLVVGGFTYMTSAGNTSTAGSGKKIIWDALLGIVAAFGAYLILYVINPDLTRITIGESMVTVSVFERMDASNPGGTTRCQSCISVQDICKENPCSLNSTLAGKLRSALQGQNARITEGWPATVNHSSSCHGNGTCADVNLTLNKRDVQAVKNLYEKIKAAGLNPVYEDTATGCAKYTAVGVNCHPYPTMTAPSFHVSM